MCMSLSMLDSALQWRAAGCSVIRTTIDGTKAPLGEWKQYQSQRADESTLERWFGKDHPGMGIVCGAVSGNLEMLEFEGRALELVQPFLLALGEHSPVLLSKLYGYIE